MTTETKATGSAPARFLGWLPALVAAQCVLVMGAMSLDLPHAAWTWSGKLSIAAVGLVQGLLLLLCALPLLFLLSWPWLRLQSARAALLGTGVVWSLFVAIQAALDHYFHVAGTPLGADLFGYSRAEIATTVADGAATGALTWMAIVVPLLVLWGGLAWRARYQPRPRSRLAIGLLAAAIAAWALPLSPGARALPDDTARELASSKLAWFTADTLRWSRSSVRRPAAAESPAAVAGGAAAPDAPLDPAYPFLHPDQSPDALGPYFSVAGDGQPPNVVLIVVEGLGRSFSGPHASLGSFTPYLDELATRSLYFENFLANQGRTFAVLPSLLGSLPFGDQGFNALGERMPAHPGLFNVLRRQGYQTAFYNGTDTRFDNEKAYLQLQQVQSIVDLDSFGAGYQRNPFSAWGYPDRELVSRVLADNTKLKPPFALALQTISMHTSYQFPGQEAYRTRFEQRLQELAVSASKLASYRANADIYSTILYTDDQLRRYFESVAQTPWFANTIFVITGDHRLPEIPMGEHVDRYHVPLLIYSPLLKQPARIRAVSSHLDVTPSLLALLSHTYGLKRPEMVPWLGSGLDMSESFRNQHEIPLKQTKTSPPEFVVGRWWLRDGKLYELGDGMSLAPADDAPLQAWVSQRLRRYEAANATFLDHLALMPHDAAPALVAYDSSTTKAPVALQAPARPAAGLTLETVQLQPSPGAVEIVGTFTNGDAVQSAMFVPLAVMTSEDGREVQEAYGAALRLGAHERREVRLVLRHAGVAPGRYYLAVRPSDPDTGKPLGRGRFHIPLDLAADGNKQAMQ